MDDNEDDFRGRWGRITDYDNYQNKRGSNRFYDDVEDDDGEDGAVDSRLDPAKLYLFASLLDDEEPGNMPLNPRMPLRRRLIL